MQQGDLRWCSLGCNGIKPLALQISGNTVATAASEDEL